MEIDFGVSFFRLFVVLNDDAIHALLNCYRVLKFISKDVQFILLWNFKVSLKEWRLVPDISSHLIVSSVNQYYSLTFTLFQSPTQEIIPNFTFPVALTLLLGIELDFFRI